MLARGPFGLFPFSDVGTRAARMVAEGEATAAFATLPFATTWSATGSTEVIFGGSTAWDQMLAQAEAPIAYFAEIEPWVLTDRS
ncbi:hypothetical protein OZ411_01345 [Bradyrhizobium sp. Arg237L]|uniref:hypothetical protein n=1 Tax=Bradyrhizobium sp. Arg237L TaxID=3003352 RepID=UPI00249E8AB2|nr:hypothetical protein [Bradyrhizobium sp. Arg237L]MDI4231458.1 hypothetical protein [Bradyrhizobium sp. Arg237L]